MTSSFEMLPVSKLTTEQLDIREYNNLFVYLINCLPLLLTRCGVASRDSFPASCWVIPFLHHVDKLSFWRRIFLKILAHPVFKM